jgi:hypothetical protein
MLSNQPQLRCVTLTALLASWVLQPIEGMTSLGPDFETHVKWQGSIEEPAPKDFIARKVRTIEWNKVQQGTSWNAIKCEDRLRSCPEAVVRQATINLDSQVWKSLGDSFPKLYCVNLAEAYVTEEMSVEGILREKKRYRTIRSLINMQSCQFSRNLTLPRMSLVGSIDIPTLGSALNSPILFLF